MSDIRVYWDNAADKYYVFIGNSLQMIQWGSDMSMTSDVVAYDEGCIEVLLPLIYEDHAEDYTLIDENLRVPDLIDICTVSMDEECGWLKRDHEAWSNGLFEHYVYHEERTA